MPASMFNRSLSAKAPVIALIIITVIWGGSFLTVQYGLNFSSPIMLVGLRFAAAAIAEIGRASCRERVSSPV